MIITCLIVSTAACLFALQQATSKNAKLLLFLTKRMFFVWSPKKGSANFEIIMKRAGCQEKGWGGSTLLNQPPCRSLGCTVILQIAPFYAKLIKIGRLVAPSTLQLTVTGFMTFWGSLCKHLPGHPHNDSESDKNTATFRINNDNISDS